MTEICPVSCSGGDMVEPLPSFGEAGLMAVVAADGFVIVPEASEGHPQGASVTVYLYEQELDRQVGSDERHSDRAAQPRAAGPIP
jgi:molybdopterin biosynthesis enzyme